MRDRSSISFSLDKIFYYAVYLTYLWVMIDPFKRYQQDLSMMDLFPDLKNGRCTCGCGLELDGRKRKWATYDCRIKAVIFYFVIKGDNATIRNVVFSRDKGCCANCGNCSEDWQADHITPVHKGGGGCYLENFQTLCKRCHIDKSILDYSSIDGHRAHISRQAFSTSFII